MCGRREDGDIMKKFNTTGPCFPDEHYSQIRADELFVAVD